MAIVSVEINDDLAKYLQAHATSRGILLSEVIDEMISENLMMSHEIDDAIEIAGVDVSDSEHPIIDTVRMLVGILEYHQENVRLLEKDSLGLFTLKKIDARLPKNRTRDGFICDLMDRLEEIEVA